MRSVRVRDRRSGVWRQRRRRRTTDAHVAQRGGVRVPEQVGMGGPAAVAAPLAPPASQARIREDVWGSVRCPGASRSERQALRTARSRRGRRAGGLHGAQSRTDSHSSRSTRRGGRGARGWSAPRHHRRRTASPGVAQATPGAGCVSLAPRRRILGRAPSRRAPDYLAPGPGRQPCRRCGQAPVALPMHRMLRAASTDTNVVAPARTISGRSEVVVPRGAVL